LFFSHSPSHARIPVALAVSPHGRSSFLRLHEQNTFTFFLHPLASLHAPKWHSLEHLRQVAPL
jgi:hypothetical protein